MTSILNKFSHQLLYRAFLFTTGCALPNPQPPSRSWATMAPAHLPVWKPQQPEAQSASLVQGPVINCFPAPLPAPLLVVDACVATGVEGLASGLVTTRRATSRK